MKNKALLLVLAAAILSPLAPSSAQAKSAKPNCFLTVTRKLHIGEVQTEKLELTKPNKKECEKAAKVYETNFTPASVESKKVEFRWKP